MSTPPRMIVLQARTALNAGRPDEAYRLLQPLISENDRRAWALIPEVASVYAERGERALRSEDVEQAWNDLLRAEQLDDKPPAVVQLRETLTRLGLASARALLENGKTLLAIQLIVQLRNRKVRHADLNIIQEAAQDWLQGQEQADRGDFLLASQTIERLRARFPVPSGNLERFIEELESRHGQFRAAIGQMQDAIEANQWAEVIRFADQAYAAAPQNREAQQARIRAWESLKPAPGVRPNPDATIADGTQVLEPRVAEPPVEVITPTPSDAPAKRFLLWIDGVGGYLVCLTKRVSFGQAMSDAPIEIPIYAELAPIHAVIERDEEAYMLESSRFIMCNGAAIDRVVLQSGDKISLGQTCQLQFTRPIPISMTAKLEILSGHRLPMGLDDVILMADNLIIGPPGKAHIVVPGLDRPVILMKQGSTLSMKFQGDFRMGGQPAKNHASLPIATTIDAGQVVFSIEPYPMQRNLGTRLAMNRLMERGSTTESS